MSAPDAGRSPEIEHPPRVALIGGGPRAVSTLERLAVALDGTDARGEIHVFDDVQPGAGRVWRTDQPHELCMNTLAHAVSLFTDASVSLAGRVAPGPTLHEWSLVVAGRDCDVDPAFVRMLEEIPPRDGIDVEYAEELAGQRPESHPSRALFGEYLSWCYTRARAQLPRGVTVVEHRARVTALHEHEGRLAVLASGVATVEADTVALLPGWLPRTLDEREHVFARAEDRSDALIWIRPGSPVDQPLDRIPDGADVIVRGLGMGFFDAMAMLTIGRGGRFEENDGALRYIAGGREPVLHVTSRRGLPFRAKSLYGALPPRLGHRHLRGGSWLTSDGPIDFDADVWPLIVKDALEQYCALLPNESLSADRATTMDAIASEPNDADAVLRLAERLIGEPEAAARFTEIFHDCAPPASTDEFSAIATRFLREDLAESVRGADSALKAALWSISSARTTCSRAGAFGRFTAESLPGYRRFQAIGAMAGSGPPAFRNRQLLALVEAGLVRFLGPRTSVEVSPDDGVFVVHDASGVAIDRAPVLLDAWMHFHDSESTADPLFARLLADGRVRPFRIGPHHATPTGGIDVEAGTWRVIDRTGQPDPRLLLAGIPLEQTTGDTIISPMPGSNSTMLRECDAIGRQLAGVLAAEHAPTGRIATALADTPLLCDAGT